jgi:hypothetical protein
MRALGYTGEVEADALKAAGAQPFERMADLPELIGLKPALSLVE